MLCKMQVCVTPSPEAVLSRKYGCRALQLIQTGGCWSLAFAGRMLSVQHLDLTLLGIHSTK